MNTNDKNNAVYHIADTVFVVKDHDEWSVVDNGAEDADLNLRDAVRYALEYIIDREDAEAWHRGELTRHLENALENVKLLMPDCEVQIWGVPSGEEPLRVIVK